MSQLVADCPRCSAKRTAFNLLSSTYIKEIFHNHGMRQMHEAFCVCLHCSLSTTFSLIQKDSRAAAILELTSIAKLAGSVNEIYDVIGYISLKDAAATQPPGYLPPEIEAVFNEGATCFAVGCFNAAGTMFRLCVDMASKALVPEGSPKNQTKMLAPRLKWLFEQEILAKALLELSDCIKDDGNDGAHDGTLTKVEAEDLLDFTFSLLERLYTEPAKIQINIERRAERKKQTV